MMKPLNEIKLNELSFYLRLSLFTFFQDDNGNELDRMSNILNLINSFAVYTILINNLIEETSLNWIDTLINEDDLKGSFIKVLEKNNLLNNTKEEMLSQSNLVISEMKKEYNLIMYSYFKFSKTQDDKIEQLMVNKLTKVIYNLKR